jgi:zeaxanthin glucosyltransferase
VEIGDLTAERLADLIQRVQANPSYRDRARYFQRVIARTHGLDLAADVIERAFKKNQIVDSARQHAAPLHT